MQFIFTIILALAAIVSATNSVLFVNRDSKDRTIYFTPNAGYESVSSLSLPGGAWLFKEIPHAWIGNFYSVTAGSPNVPGMLGEVNFNSWGGMTYFDVSAIVNANDHEGVSFLFPMVSKFPFSGCAKFPCAQVYNLADDIQTKTTLETTLIALIGPGPSPDFPVSKRSHARDLGAISYPRSFVTAQ